MKAALGIACLLCATASHATAQVVPPAIVLLPFDFANPGAKSLALGGAFVALADDATATYANPAGLTQLNASDVSMEFRGASVTSRYLQGGRLSGIPRYLGDDTHAGPIFGEAVTDHTGLGFLAGVYMHQSRRWVVAGYRHELLRVNQTFAADTVHQFWPGPFEATTSPSRGEQQAEITAYGFAGSFKIRQSLSVGAGLTAYAFSLDSTVEDHAGDREVFRLATQNGESVSWAPTVGVIVGRDERRFGAVYRRGASFEITSKEKHMTGPREETTYEGRFRVPNTLSVGGSFRVTPPLTLAIEVKRVWYSRLFHDLIKDYIGRSERYLDDLSIRDGTEIHGGVQYAVVRWRGLPRFRAGFWIDPDHSLHYTAPDKPADPQINPDQAVLNDYFAAALPNDTKRVHFTGGVGVTLGRRLELNAGFDRTSTTHVLSISVIFMSRAPF